MQKIRKKSTAGAIWQGICDWSVGRDLFGRPWVRVIWDDLMAYQTPQTLGQDLTTQLRWTWRAVKRVPGWVWQGPMVKRILKVIPGLLGEVGVLLLFVFVVVMSIVFMC